MLIKKIQVNNFGKLKNKEIELKNRINVIYGANESGKSTLLDFIVSMFYGINRSKNGKEISILGSLMTLNQSSPLTASHA